MKNKWRALLTQCLRNESTKKSSVLSKDAFPQQLKKLDNAMAENTASNLKSDFHEATIYPVNKDKILRRLPQKGKAQVLSLKHS